MSGLAKLLIELKAHAVEADQFEIKEYDHLEIFREKYLTGFISKLVGQYGHWLPTAFVETKNIK